MENKPSLKKNYALNIIYQMLVIIVPLITTPYVSRILEANGIGEYSYTLSVVSYFSMIAALGMSTYGQLQIAKYRDDKNKRSVFFFEILMAKVMTTAVMTILYIVCSGVLSANSDLYFIMIIYLVADAIDISWFFQGLEEFKLTVFRNTVIKLISTACIFIFIKSKSDLALYACILQCSTLIGNISLWPYLKKYINFPGVKSLKIFRHWKYSVVYFIPTIATSVYTVLDKSMIGIITKSSYENGYYEQAYKIEQILIVLLTSLGTVTLPRMAYLWEKKDEDTIRQMLKTTINFILCISFPMMVGVMVVSDKLIPIFLGDGYKPCISLLSIFSILLVVVGLDNTIGKQCLVATGRQKQFNIGVTVGAIVNFFANLILISFKGAIGAAIGSVIAEIVILSIFMYFSRDLLNIHIMITRMIKYFTLSAIMGLVAFGVGKFVSSPLPCIIVQVLVGLIIYFILLLIVRDPVLRSGMALLKSKKLFSRIER